jgi:hypothetical protein
VMRRADVLRNLKADIKDGPNHGQRTSIAL